LPPLDIGDLQITENLEESQVSLGRVIAELLKRDTIPIVLGGGHETAYGHYLGYVRASLPIAVVNIDAHLDVRPLIDGNGHSGSPFRQMLEHPGRPLPGADYLCVGAQPGQVSKAHWEYQQKRGGKVWWRHETYAIADQLDELPRRRMYLSIDADAFHVSDVPGVSAPNSNGLYASDAYDSAHWAGRQPEVASLDLVEINPRLDRDGQSARWAALVIWNFLVGLALRNRSSQ
jgi:formiminoglutamase